MLRNRDVEGTSPMMRGLKELVLVDPSIDVGEEG